MAIKTRADLKALFANGCIPTQKEFCDLIDSFLNRKDDSLFGEWKPGVAYEEGDVVLYGNSLYILRLDAETGGEESQCSSSSNAPGSPEGSNWQLLDFELQDDDWNVLIPGADGEMVAGVYGRIGMGTSTPKARVDITDGEKGKFLFGPLTNDSSCPVFKIVKNLGGETGQEDTYLKTTVKDEVVEWDTNSAGGYIFKRQGIEVGAFATRGPAIQIQPPQPIPTPEALVSINEAPDGNAVLGVGTVTPQGMVEAMDERNQRTIHLNPISTSNAEVRLSNLQSGNIFSHNLSANHAMMYTDAPQGLQLAISQGGKPATALVVASDGKVGIGTGSPETLLQVTDQDTGDFRFSLRKDNPALAIVNTRPETGETENYLTIGADNDYAVFKTNSEMGFLFMKGSAPGGTLLEEENINNGDQLVFIKPDGKMGLGVYPEDNFQLEVNGAVRASGMILAEGLFLPGILNANGSLSGVLGKVVHLNAVTRTDGGKKKVGFNPGNIEEQFNDLDLFATDGNKKSIAYQNMVPILVQAIKEMVVEIDGLKQQLSNLNGGS